MLKFEAPPEDLPPCEPTAAAWIELDRIARKARRLVLVAAVYLASEREPRGPRKKPVPVDREHILQAAEVVFVPQGERRVPWLNELVDSLLFDSCFLSHSTKDKQFCERLYQQLKAHDVGCWYFPEDAEWGRSIWEQIDRGITLYDKLLVVCSKHSLQSGPVLREVERALQREDDELRHTAQPSHILFPITIDNYVFTKWQHPRKADLLSNVVGDFRGWKRSPAKFDAALVKLLKHLQAEDNAKR